MKSKKDKRSRKIEKRAKNFRLEEGSISANLKPKMKLRLKLLKGQMN